MQHLKHHVGDIGDIQKRKFAQEVHRSVELGVYDIKAGHAKVPNYSQQIYQQKYGEQQGPQLLCVCQAFQKKLGYQDSISQLYGTMHRNLEPVGSNPESDEGIGVNKNRGRSEDKVDIFKLTQMRPRLGRMRLVSKDQD